MAKKKYPSKEEAAAAGFFPRNALREMRLKPTRETPTLEYWQGFSVVVAFSAAGCVPMRPYRPATAGQIQALAEGRSVVRYSVCRRCKKRNIHPDESDSAVCDDCEIESRRNRLRALFDTSGRVVYLDTETTGLYAGADEILEIAIVDDDGETLLHTLVRPVSNMEWPEAERIHGIKPAMVASAPTLEDITPALLEIMTGADQLVIYNAPFDLGFLPPTVREIAKAKARCAMRAYALWNGEWSFSHSDYRWHKLIDAADSFGYEWTGEAHRALVDTLAARHVWQRLRAMDLSKLPR